MGIHPKVKHALEQQRCPEKLQRYSFECLQCNFVDAVNELKTISGQHDDANMTMIT